MKRNLFAILLSVMLVTALMLVAPGVKAEESTLITAEAGKTYEITENGVTLDLLGQKNVIVDIAEGVELSVIDSGNMELDGSTAGTLTVKGEGTIAHISRDADYRYLAVETDGIYSFHPFNMMVTGIGINTIKNEICLRVSFIANTVVRDNYLDDYGASKITGEICDVSAAEKYPFEEKHGVHAYFDLDNSLSSENIDEKRSFKAYMVVDGEKVLSAYTAEVTPRQVLKQLNSTDLVPTDSQMERINTLIAENSRVANILTRFTGKTCVHHGGSATCTAEAICLDCDAFYGEKADHQSENEAVRENVIDATCGADGSYENVVYCSVCSIELSRTTEVVPATENHTYGEWTLTSASTYYTEGVETQSCICGASNERSTAKLVAPDNLITSFDTEDSLSSIKRYWDCCNLSIDSTVAHGDDKASLKVEVTVANDNYIIINAPLNDGDFSEYDYISFWVYNAGSADFKMGTTWAADTTCVAGQWTEVKITKAMFEASKVTDMSSNVLGMSNVAKLPLRIFSASNLAVGDCFYISSVTTGKYAPDDVVVNFDEASDLQTVSVYWPTAHNIAIDTATKHGDDAGSLKVTLVTNSDNYIILSAPYNTDFSEYDYISFWVYNAGSADFEMGTTWAADTTCIAGQWTEVKITKEMFEASKVKDMSNAVLAMADVTNLPLRIFGTSGLTAGESFYISAVRGGNNA